MFVEAKQNNPIDESQSLIPHAQFSELTEVPSTSEHDAYGRQVFVEDVHTKPVDTVQSLVPHAQFPELTEVPSTTEHGK